MSDLEENLSILRQINPRRIREMSMDDVYDLNKNNGNLVTTANIDIDKLAKDITDIRLQLANENGDIMTITSTVESLSRSMTDKKNKIEKLNNKIENLYHRTSVLFVLAAILILSSVIQWCMILSLSHRNFKLDDRIDQMEVDLHHSEDSTVKDEIIFK